MKTAAPRRSDDYIPPLPWGIQVAANKLLIGSVSPDQPETVDEIGVTSRKGPLRTLKAADRQSGSSLDPEASVTNVRFSGRQRD
jgi:hypothetical protein